MAGLNGIIENKSDEYRPCTVNGTKALFHRWADKDLIILKSECFLNSDKIELLREKYEETHVVPRGVSIEKTRLTLAIVEFEDGLVKEIEPTSVRFLDSGNIFHENALIFECSKEVSFENNAKEIAEEISRIIKKQVERKNTSWV